MTAKEFMDMVKDYFDKNLIGTDATEVSEVNTDKTYTGPKGTGYIFSIKNSNAGMIFYPESFQYIADYENGRPIADIANEINKIATDFAADARRTANYELDISDETIIVTALLSRNVPKEMSDETIMKELPDVGLTLFLKAPVIGLERHLAYGSILKEKYGKDVTEKDWLKGLANSVKMSDIQALPLIMNKVTNQPLAIMIRDAHAFTDYFYLQIPLDKYADLMGVDKFLVLPSDPYSANIYAAPKGRSDEEVNGVFKHMVSMNKEDDIPAYIYSKETGKLTLF